MSSRTVVDDLIRYLFADPQHPLATRMSSWLGASRSFTAFVTTYSNKIRKKVRTASDADSILDLQLELETAFVLLNHRHLNVAYEPYGRDTRSPDFAVTLTTKLTFNVEVTRLRRSSRTSDPSHDTPGDLERLVEIVAGKLTQFRPHMSNVLIIQSDAVPADQAIQVMINRLKRRAEQGNDALLMRYGLHDPADFVRYFERLSVLLIRSDRLGSQPPALWINPQARPPLPPSLIDLIRQYHTTSYESP